MRLLVKMKSFKTNENKKIEHQHEVGVQCADLAQRRNTGLHILKISPLDVTEKFQQGDI